uniref:Uncharacterized protein n=1 Tax=Anguilla anguilla TaxID=7936 RepID=A0A0E9PAQ0_ANGAN
MMFIRCIINNYSLIYPFKLYYAIAQYCMSIGLINII